MSVSSVVKPVRWGIGWLVVGLMALLLVAPSAGAQSANAMVRVVHAVPDAPAVDVYVNGNRVLSNVPFAAVSDYLSVPAGSHTVRLLAAGTPASGQAALEGSVSVQAGQAYTLAATGRLANIALAAINDNLSAPPSGRAKVRLVHLSPDAPSVDVAVDGGPTLFQNVAFRSAGDYQAVDPGAYNLVVRPAGQQAVALRVPDVSAQSGTTYTVFALGLAQGQPALAAKAVVDARASAPAMPRTGAGGMDAVTAPAPLVALALGLAGVAAIVALRRLAAR